MVQVPNEDDHHRHHRVLRWTLPGLVLASLTFCAFTWPSIDAPLAAVFAAILVWLTGRRGE